MYEIPLSKPEIGPLERRYVDRVLSSDRLAMGPFTARFEAAMATACGTRHAVAVSSGTGALHLSALALGLRPGDEVVTTPYSFVASSNVLLYAGATPRFVDIDPETYHLDAERAAAAITPATRGLLPVDVFGLPADWPALARLADEHGLFLLDDACHGLGAALAGRPLGSWGDAACFGFYPNKQITTGEGGCITTDSDALAARCRSLRNQGRSEDGRMEHVHLGFNYRMSELEAALGCAQLERLTELLDRRARAAALYREALAPLQPDLALPAEPAPEVQRSWFVYVVRLADHFTEEARDVLMHRLREQGIGCAPYFPSIHLQPYYRRRFGFKPGDFPVCEAVSARTLALPFFGALTEADVHRVAGALEAALPMLPCKTRSAWVQNL
ncbi:MAG: DegT/DnrJ/EryC1/StrS family aminotransferase [Rhodothermales bacterium]|nr:DegT/DnrJ/EryC1/StrS family aminotransferase [Rhodothermales bacterium]